MESLPFRLGNRELTVQIVRTVGHPLIVVTEGTRNVQAFEAHLLPEEDATEEAQEAALRDVIDKIRSGQLQLKP